MGYVGFGNSPSHGGLFKKPAEDQSPAAGGAPVETEGELLQIGLQVGWNDRALVSTEDPTFKEAGDSVYAWHGTWAGSPDEDNTVFLRTYPCSGRSL